MIPLVKTKVQSFDNKRKNKEGDIVKYDCFMLTIPESLRQLLNIEKADLVYWIAGEDIIKSNNKVIVATLEYKTREG